MTMILGTSIAGLIMALGKKLSPLLLGLVLLVGLLAFLNWPQEQAGQTMAKKTDAGKGLRSQQQIVSGDHRCTGNRYCE